MDISAPPWVVKEANVAVARALKLSYVHVQQLRWIVYRSHIKLPSQVACPHIVCELIAWVTIKSLMSLICAKQNYHSWDFTRSMIPHITSHKGAIRGKMTLLLQMKPFDSLVLHCGLKRFVNVGYDGVAEIIVGSSYMY